MIEAQQLHKAFKTRTGTVKAVDGVDFRAGDGRITGLLGPNGAGKTTALRMLYTLMKPDSGQVRVDGIDASADPAGVRRVLGVLPDARGIYKRLTARENIAYFGQLHGLSRKQIAERTRALSQQLDMDDILDRRTEGFSQGQRTKTAIARALVHDPRNVILDEPTNGLDPSQIQHMRSLVRELARDATLIISTHVLQEVEAVCSRVLIMRGGQLALDSALDAIGRPKRLLVTLDCAPEEARPVLAQIEGVTGVEAWNGDAGLRHFALSAADPQALAPLVAKTLGGQPWNLYALAPERRDLEDLFGAVTLEQMEVAHV